MLYLELIGDFPWLPTVIDAVSISFGAALFAAGCGFRFKPFLTPMIGATFVTWVILTYILLHTTPVSTISSCCAGVAVTAGGVIASKILARLK